MKRIRIFLPLAVFIFPLMASGQSTKSSADESESLAEQPQQSPAPRPAPSRSEEMLDRWNDIGNKLIAMAQDFPEDKYDFKVQKDERTFAQNLLHAAALDFVLIRRVSGSNLGPDFGEGDNPSRSVFKTKADVGKFVQEAVADGAKVIQQQGDAGLDNAGFPDQTSGPTSVRATTLRVMFSRPRPTWRSSCKRRRRRGRKGS